VSVHPASAVVRRGRVKVTVVCRLRSERCRGSVRLRARSTVARRSFRIAAGRRRTVTIRVGSRALRTLRAAHVRRVDLVVSGPRMRTVRRRLALRIPR
jgi:hypothetical protein